MFSKSNKHASVVLIRLRDVQAFAERYPRSSIYCLLLRRVLGSYIYFRLSSAVIIILVLWVKCVQESLHKSSDAILFAVNLSRDQASATINCRATCSIRSNAVNNRYISQKGGIPRDSMGLSYFLNFYQKIRLHSNILLYFKSNKKKLYINYKFQYCVYI